MLPSTSHSFRLAALALLAWCVMLAQRPMQVSAIDLPAFGHQLEHVMTHFETELPATPGVHAVEYWNGVVCEHPVDNSQDSQCEYPVFGDEFGQ